MIRYLELADFVEIAAEVTGLDLAAGKTTEAAAADWLRSRIEEPMSTSDSET